MLRWFDRGLASPLLKWLSSVLALTMVEKVGQRARPALAAMVWYRDRLARLSKMWVLFNNFNLNVLQYPARRVTIYNTTQTTITLYVPNTIITNQTERSIAGPRLFISGTNAVLPITPVPITVVFLVLIPFRVQVAIHRVLPRSLSCTLLIIAIIPRLSSFPGSLAFPNFS